MVEKQQTDDILEKKINEILSCSNLPNDHKDVIGTLKTTYSELSDYLAQASWIERVETIQVEATYIASIAGVAIFLGAIQTGVISYAASIAKANSKPSLILEAADVLSFCALLFDVLGALFALITSGTLLLRVSEAKGYTTTKQKLSDDIVKAVKTFMDFPEQPDEVQPSFNTLHDEGQRYHRKAQELAHLIDDHSRSYFDIILVILAGVVFFFASFFIIIASQQRLWVWLSTLVVIGVTTLMLLYMQTRRHPVIGRVFLKFRKAFLKQCWAFLQYWRSQNTIDHS